MADTIVFRSLTEPELPHWFDFLHSIFPHEAAGFFSNHWYQDAHRDLSCVFAALLNDTVIVSSLRIHWRTAWIHQQPVTVAGIGEVSTDTRYRGRGLASQLLLKVLEVMKQRGVTVSSLHTSKAAPLYAKHGWRAVPREFVRMAMTRPHAEQIVADVGAASVRIRQMNLDSDLAQVQPLQESYARQFQGSLKRDEAYWRQWMPCTTDHMFVVENAKGAVVAAGATRWKYDMLHLADFCIASDAGVDSCYAMRLIVASGLLECKHVQGEQSVQVQIPKLAVPSEWKPSEELTIAWPDLGMMYHASDETIAQLQSNHLYFDCDKF